MGVRLSLLLVLWHLRCWSVLRARMLQRFRMTLRLPGFSCCGVLVPGLKSLLVIHSLGDVRRGV